MILVTSAAGNNGRRLIPRLAARGLEVRALNRSDKARELRELGATEVIVGNALDPKVLEKAMQGVDSVFHVGPSFHPREAEMGMAVIDAAAAANVKHLVYDSVLHPQINALLQHGMKLRVEQHLINSGLTYTILQPMHYMQTIRLAEIPRTGVLAQPFALDSRMSFVDLEDKVEVAEKVLTEPGHAAATYELCSPDHLTAYEIAAMLSEILGREIQAKFVPLDPAQLRARNASGDFGDYQARAFKAMMDYYSTYGFWGNPNVLTWLLGRPPTTLREYLERELAKLG
jgi:uncharacterized protein YbjT (DUF2867 family)